MGLKCVMTDYSQQRRLMVEEQLIPRGIKAVAPFYRVPRHEFVPEELKESAYKDCPLPIGEGQTISQPYMVAIMTELLQLKPQGKVLEVGTGSGYQTAILAELSKRVYTVECVKRLSQRAADILNKLHYSNIEFYVGDGSEGLAEQAPYNGIIVTAGCPGIPPPLIEQLADEGRLVIPVGDRFLQTLTVVTKSGGKVNIQASIGCVFVPLVGKYGWHDLLE